MRLREAVWAACRHDAQGCVVDLGTIVTGNWDRVAFISQPVNARDVEAKLGFSVPLDSLEDLVIFAAASNVVLQDRLLHAVDAPSHRVAFVSPIDLPGGGCVVYPRVESRFSVAVEGDSSDPSLLLTHLP